MMPVRHQVLLRLLLACALPLLYRAGPRRRAVYAGKSG